MQNLKIVADVADCCKMLQGGISLEIEVWEPWDCHHWTQRRRLPQKGEEVDFSTFLCNVADAPVHAIAAETRYTLLIHEPLTRLFNKSLRAGHFPTSWKQANVTPIFKNKGTNSEPTNYRPISLLSCISKIFEKLVFKQVYKHLTDNNILSDKQSGCRPGHSTQLQL